MSAPDAPPLSDQWLTDLQFRVMDLLAGHPLDQVLSVLQAHRTLLRRVEEPCPNCGCDRKTAADLRAWKDDPTL